MVAGRDLDNLSTGMVAALAFIKFCNAILVALRSSTTSYVSDYNPNRMARKEAQVYFAELGRRLGSSTSESSSADSYTIGGNTTNVVGARVIAYGIDGIITGIIFVILTFPVVMVASISSKFYIFGLLSIPLYSILLETLWNGQTIGKRLLNIQVVNGEGEDPSIKQVVIRNIPAVIGFFNWLVLIVALLSILKKDTNQRIFDMIANTYVTRG